MKRALFLLLMLALPAAARVRSVRSGTPANPGEWLRQQALSEDALVARFGGARVVAVADVTHGTHELYVSRARLTEAFASHGFTTIALEAPWAEIGTDILPTNDYWFWNTEEVTGLMAAAKANGWRVEGIDPSHPVSSIDRFVAMLRAVNPSAADEAATRASCLRVTPYTRRESCRASIASLKTLVGTDEELLHAARIIEQGEEALATRLANRDAAMAENLLWLAQRGKVVTWMHNEHAGKLPYAVFDPTLVTSTGTLLAAQLGGDYAVIASVVLEGTFNAVEWSPSGLGIITAEPMPAPSPDDYAVALSAAGLDEFTIPLNAPPPWLAGPRHLRVAASSVLAPDFTMWNVSEDLAKKFDAVTFVRRSTPSLLRDRPVIR